MIKLSLTSSWLKLNFSESFRNLIIIRIQIRWILKIGTWKVLQTFKYRVIRGLIREKYWFASHPLVFLLIWLNMNASKDGWFTETGVINSHSTQISIKVEDVLYHERSKYQDILVFQRYFILLYPILFFFIFNFSTNSYP